MRSGPLLKRLALVAICIIASGGCAPRRSVISTGPDGLRTFSVIREIDGAQILCPAYGLVNPLSGTFEGQVNAREPVWIASDAGQRLSVVWPEGFSVKFGPAAVLYNEKGEEVARAGARTELSQVRPEEHKGTYEDPYIASGILYGGCYPFSP